ncbi:MAG: hypothetical protein ACE5JF_12730 [Anaerolineales bacterium]
MIVGSASFLGALFGFGNPVGCAWPEFEDLIPGRSSSPDPLVTFDSLELANDSLERHIATAIGRSGAGRTRFDSDRDFIEHASLQTSRFWRYNDDGLVSIDESIAMESIQGPISMADYMGGDYARLFRFAVAHKSISHACVIVVVQHRPGEDFFFRHMFRSIFGFGPWWGITIGGGGWSF